MTVLRIAVCVPSGDMVHMDFASALGVMLAHMAARQVPTLLINEKSAILQKSRQNLVNRASANDASHVLFLDSDMTFPPDTAERLLAHDRDIVGVAAPKRRPDLTSSAMKVWGERLTFGPDEGLIDVDWLGFGGVLIRAEVFQALDKPWFPTRFERTDPQHGDVWISEDYGFCEKARAAGYAIQVDTGLSYRFGHLGQHRFTLR